MTVNEVVVAGDEPVARRSRASSRSRRREAASPLNVAVPAAAFWETGDAKPEPSGVWFATRLTDSSKFSACCGVA